MEQYPSQPAWRNEELSDLDVQDLRQALGGVPFLNTAFEELGDQLDVGSSRTIYNLTTIQFFPDKVDVMVGTARIAADFIYHRGIEEGFSGTPLEMRTNEAPEQFEVPALPSGAKARMSPDSLIGYMRAENTEHGLKVSLGALNPQTRALYKLPLN